MLFAAGQKVLFIGDSITDCGRRDDFAPYGVGYVNLVRAMVMARYPERHLQFENRGIGGNTVPDLAARWDEDVIAEKPDWLAVKIGINDVYRSFGETGDPAFALEPYETGLRRLLKRAVDETGCKLIVITPFLIEPDRSNPKRPITDQYGQAALRLAAEFDAVAVDTQAAVDASLAKTVPTDWSTDQVHPNIEGHAVLALAILRAIGWEL